jgi:hypothetical protein
MCFKFLEIFCNYFVQYIFYSLVCTSSSVPRICRFNLSVISHRSFTFCLYFFSFDCLSSSLSTNLSTLSSSPNILSSIHSTRGLKMNCLFVYLPIHFQNFNLIFLKIVICLLNSSFLSCIL